MTSPLSKPSDYSGSSFFKPGEHMTDLALLIEPKTIERQVASTYAGTTRVRDEVIADIAVFSNQTALDSATPTEIIKSTKVTHGMLTSTLEKILGGAMAGTVTKVNTKNGSGFVFRDADAEAEAAIIKYLETRSAAVAEAPSFD